MKKLGKKSLKISSILKLLAPISSLHIFLYHDPMYFFIGPITALMSFFGLLALSTVFEYFESRCSVVKNGVPLSAIVQSRLNAYLSLSFLLPLFFLKLFDMSVVGWNEAIVAFVYAVLLITLFLLSLANLFLFLKRRGKVNPFRFFIILLLFVLLSFYVLYPLDFWWS
jgi:hypothetical protein